MKMIDFENLILRNFLSSYLPYCGNVTKLVALLISNCR